LLRGRGLHHALCLRRRSRRSCWSCHDA
jgi:hypothetical protein